jgi:hypothetical protein
MLRYILFLAVTIFAFSSVASPRNAQINKITLKERKISGEIPYQISNIVVNGEPIEMNSSFFVGSTGDEWEKKMTFNFVNTSNKDITSVHIRLMLLSQDKSKLRAAPTFFLFRSRSDVKAQDMFRDVPDLKPGETLQIKLQEKYYDSFQKMIGRVGLSNSGEIKDVIIWVYTVGFSDGTIWGYGSYYKPDPKDPTKRVPAEKVSLRSADGRSSASFCPETFGLDFSGVFCIGNPGSGENCETSVFYRSSSPGNFVRDGWAFIDCFDSALNPCDQFPTDVFATCP